MRICLTASDNIETSVYAEVNESRKAFKPASIGLPLIISDLERCPISEDKMEIRTWFDCTPQSVGVVEDAPSSVLLWRLGKPLAKMVSAAPLLSQQKRATA